MLHWKNALNALLGRNRSQVDLLPRVQALEAAEQAVAERLAKLEEMLGDTEETWAKVRRLAGRIYAMKRWDEVQDSESNSDRAAVQRMLLRSKLGVKGE